MESYKLTVHEIWNLVNREISIKELVRDVIEDR